MTEVADDSITNDLAPLLCSLCNGDVTTEPTSVKCDFDSCRGIFHPSCLGDSGPIDNERWFCDKHTIGTPDDICGSCHKGQGNRKARWIECDACSTWYHISCVGVSVLQYDHIEASGENGKWFCKTCKNHGQMDPNRLKWGNFETEEEIRDMVNNVYTEVVSWDKNIMLLPRGKAGKTFINELSRLLSLFTLKSVWEPVALSLVHIFVPLMLQKPSHRSKAKDNTKYLMSRLQKWEQGNVWSILSECREIQKKIKKINQTKDLNVRKSFCQKMLEGKIGQAIRLVDNENRTGLLPITEDTLRMLKEKHPTATKRNGPEVTPETPVEPVIFEGIDASAVQNAAKNTFGSGGPCLIDADGWKHMLCSKSFGKAGENLAQTIADLAKRLCTESVNSDFLTELLASRLIPLEKHPNGVRPIGIGEVMRRIMGKTVTRVLKQDVIEASGTLQTCSGIDSGIEAAVHAMADKFAEDETQGLLLVDATNAFNSIYREKALDTVATHCPVFHQYLKNTYQARTKLYISGSKEGEYLWSEEGNTQGDVAAMPFYAVATRPIIDDLRENCNATMVWYADDSSSCGKLSDLLDWWKRLCHTGPAYGYHPNAGKTVLIVKNTEDLDEAETLFKPLGVHVTVSGQRHLGAVVGTLGFKQAYINEKVGKWIKDVEELANIAKDEPQLAYSAFVKGICHRWTFYMRTIPHINENLLPLEKKISEVFIPALLGRAVSSFERDILELPVRYGGLGITNPARTAQREYNFSREITKPVVDLILNQDQDVKKLPIDDTINKKRELKQEKEEFLKARYDILSSLQQG